MDFQAEKEIVRAHQKAQIEAKGGNVAEALARHMAPDCTWRGYHPFNELTGPEQVAARFWQPLHASFTHLQRREDIFFAGCNEIDGFASRWVVSMGHLAGLFDAPWLGIPPTGRMAFLRYGAFYRVEGGAVRDVAMFLDIPHLMVQAGLHPFPEQAGANLVQPGPQTHAGLLYDAQAPEEGAKTLAAINAMIADLGQW